MDKGYCETKRAAADTHKVIWSTWLAAGVLWFILANLAAGVPYLNDAMMYGLFIGGVLATAGAVRAHVRALRREDRARRRALRDQ